MYEEPVSACDYDSPDAKQFCEDMEDAGLTVTHYHGRCYWEGPSVVVSQLSDAMAPTKVRCQHDSMGKDYVVYPIKSAVLKDRAPTADIQEGAPHD